METKARSEAVVAVPFEELWNYADSSSLTRSFLEEDGGSAELSPPPRGYGCSSGQSKNDGIISSTPQTHPSPPSPLDRLTTGCSQLEPSMSDPP